MSISASFSFLKEDRQVRWTHSLMIAFGFGEFFFGQLRSAGDPFVVVVLVDEHKLEDSSSDKTRHWHVPPSGRASKRSVSVNVCLPFFNEWVV